MDYINYVKQSPMMGQIGLGGGAASLGRYTSAGGGGPRGIWGGGQPATPRMDFVTINTLGNAAIFGNLYGGSRRWLAGASNGTRGIFAGGYNVNTISYITCSTEGNGTDFGDLTIKRYAHGGFGNATRGCFGGGDTNETNDTIDYITIANTGNASDFGDLTQGRYNIQGCASATRGLFVGGYGPNTPTYSYNIIDYVTIASTGNATDYGDLEQNKSHVGCVDNDTRACLGGGGWAGGNLTDAIGYVTIANTGNTTDFGDLTAARDVAAGTNDKTVGVDRGCFGGGWNNASWINTIDYITISNTGNAADFGDLTIGRARAGGVSGGDAA